MNVRRAVAAAIDRSALRQTRGGPAVGTVATHFIPPDTDGFEHAGGEAGPGYDFYKDPAGNVALAKEYLKKAGYKDGMYTGAPVFAVGTACRPRSRPPRRFRSSSRRSAST